MEFSSPSAALDAIGFGRLQWFLLFYTGMAWFADACEVMLLSFLGPSIHCYWGVSAGQESILTSVVFAGMLAGVYTLGALADSAGRRQGFLISAALLGAAGLASAVAPSFTWLIIFRAIVGVALGGTPIVITLFAEFVPSAQRGRWLLLMQSFWTIGTMFEACLAWAVIPSLGWRWLLALSAAPLLLLLVLYPWVPESPHWLLMQGRFREAEQVVLKVAAMNRYHRQMRLRFGEDNTRQHAGDSSDTPASAPAEQGTLHQTAGNADAGLRDRGDPKARSGACTFRKPAAEGGHHKSMEGSMMEDVAEGTEWLLGERLPGAAVGGQGDMPSVRRMRRRAHEEGGGSGPSIQGELPARAGAVLKEGGEAAARKMPPHRPAGSAPAVVVVEEENSEAGEQECRRLELPAAAKKLGRSWRRFFKGMRAAFKELYGPRLLKSSLLLYLIWFVNAITYYGLVLLTTALQTASKEEKCTDSGGPNLSAGDFTTILITSMAEAPGLLAAALLVDSWGRRWTLRTLLCSCACCTLLLAMSLGQPAWQLLLLFVARGSIEGSYSALYIYTPEVYPTMVRAFGLALCNACSRIGGFLAPFATVYLVEEHDPKASELLLGTLCLIALLAAFFLPIETKGLDLHAHDEDMAADLQQGGKEAAAHRAESLPGEPGTLELKHDPGGLGEALEPELECGHGRNELSAHRHAEHQKLLRGDK